MKTKSGHHLALSAAAACTLLLMGANVWAAPHDLTTQVTGSPANGMITGGTSTAASHTTGSAISRPTPSAISRMTGSTISRPTSSVATRTTGSLVSGVTSSMTATAVCGGVQAPALSPSDDELAHTVNFERTILALVKAEAHGHLHRLIGYDEDNYQIMAPGIAIQVPEERTDLVLAALRRQLLPLHYLAFVVEMNAGLKIDQIGVLKGTDQYEILRVMHTDGDDYEISNQDVIDRLKEWEKRSTFEIVGADSDWVELEFKTLPQDLRAFVEEVYEFCPDAVDQGPGTVDGLMQEIRKTNRLYLWWD